LNDNPFVREDSILKRRNINNVPVESLELSSRTLNCLKRADINDVGDVLDISPTELLRIRNFGQKSYKELFGRMRNRMGEFAAQRGHADEDLGEESIERGANSTSPLTQDEQRELLELIRLPTSGPTASAPVPTFDELLVEQQIDDVLFTLGDREARVLQLRFGLEDGRQRTLEEVGRDFALSRERIRQIEAKALRKLRHPTRSMKLRPALSFLVDLAETTGSNFNGNNLAQVYSAMTDSSPSRLPGHVNLLAKIFGRYEKTTSPLKAFDIFVNKCLLETLHPLSVVQLEAAIRRHPEAFSEIANWPRLDVGLRLKLVLGVEIDGQGICSPAMATNFGLNRRDRRLSAIIRVLQEEGEPLHCVRIAERIGSLLPGSLGLTKRNVEAWVNRYDQHFKWAGRGTYGLAKWDIGVRDAFDDLDEDLKPARREGVGNEIALLLFERNEPTELRLLVEHIRRRFVVNESSVLASIQQDKAQRFVLMDDDQVALARWYGKS